MRTLGLSLWNGLSGGTNESVGAAREQGGERDLGFDARQGAADAAVHPAAERHRSDVATGDVEPVGSG